MRSPTYQPSGSVPALTGVAFVCCLACAGLGAFQYAWVMLNGNWLLSLCFIGAFPVWLILIVKYACHMAKVRNPGLMREFGLVVGLAGWTLHWIFWILFASHDSVASMPGQSLSTAVAALLAEPQTLHRAFTNAVAVTEWFEEDPSLWLRCVWWLVECSVMVMAPSRAGFAWAGRPFCEARKQWATVDRLPYLFDGRPLLKGRAHLATHPAQLLATLSLGRRKDCYAEVTVFTGKYDTFISVMVSALKFDGGHVRREEEVIVEYLRVSAGDLASLKERLDRPAQPRTKRAEKKTKRPGKKVSNEELSE
jgi:hypothetical protein